MARRRMRPVAVLAALSLGGCGTLDDRGPNVTVRDSAGVRIVENGTVADVEPSWRLSEEPIFRVGWGVQGLQFGNVSAGAILEDGTFAVADYLADQVYVLSQEGDVLHVLGREGQGPGEFQSISALVALGGDSLLVQDGLNRRLETFVGGEYVGGVPFHEPVLGGPPFPNPLLFYGLRLAQRTPRGGLLLLPTSKGWIETPDAWLESPVLRATLDGAPTDTIAHVGIMNFQGQRLSVYMPVGGVSSWPEGIVTALSDRPEVRWMTEFGGLRQIARWESSREAYEQEVWRQREARLRATEPDMSESEYRAEIASWREGEEERPLPLFGYLKADTEGNAWLGAYDFSISGSVDTRPAPSYSVITADGRWIGSVDAPDNFSPLHIGSDYILGVEADPFDVHAVSVYRILKGVE